MTATLSAYGGCPDGQTDNTAAFAAAIAACAAAGGGKVVVEPGRYVTGTINLQSNVELHLESGAVILGSEHYKDYTGTKGGCEWYRDFSHEVWPECQRANPCNALIVADGCVNCGITGRGVIDGRRSSLHGHTEEKGKPFMAVFADCEQVYVENVTMQNPGLFTTYFIRCDDVRVEGITVHSENCQSGDGIDTDCSSNVRIANCFLSTGDDAISIKSLSKDRPCENYTITGCHFRCKWWGAVRIGPESASDMRNITVSNCTFEDCGDGIKIQSCDGGTFENFTFTGLVMNRVVRPIFVTVSPYRNSLHSREVPGPIRHVRIQNVVATQAQWPLGTNVHTVNPVPKPHETINYLYTCPGIPVEDFTISDCTFRLPGGGTAEEAARRDYPELTAYTTYPEMLLDHGRFPAAGLFVRHFQDLTLRNVYFKAEQPDGRPAIAAGDVADLRLPESRTVGCAELVQIW